MGNRLRVNSPVLNKLQLGELQVATRGILQPFQIHDNSAVYK
jgi:hypothetical protein